MKLLLGSGGLRTPERKNMYLQLMNENFKGCRRILFIPYASKDYDEYTNKVREMFKQSEYEIIGIHESDNPIQEIREMEGIYVGGGNTFTLVRKLHEEGLIESIRERVTEDNIPYAGVSAGSNVACPTMQTTNDMPIDLVPSLRESIQNPDYLIEDSANKGWVRGGIPSREITRDNDYFNRKYK